MVYINTTPANNLHKSKSQKQSPQIRQKISTSIKFHPKTVFKPHKSKPIESDHTHSKQEKSHHLTLKQPHPPATFRKFQHPKTQGSPHPTWGSTSRIDPTGLAQVKPSRCRQPRLTSSPDEQ